MGKSLTALMTGQHLLYWLLITVDEGAPFMEVRPLMQLCAAFCRPLRNEEATCTGDSIFKATHSAEMLPFTWYNEYRH